MSGYSYDELMRGLGQGEPATPAAGSGVVNIVGGIANLIPSGVMAYQTYQEGELREKELKQRQRELQYTLAQRQAEAALQAELLRQKAALDAQNAPLSAALASANVRMGLAVVAVLGAAGLAAWGINSAFKRRG